MFCQNCGTRNEDDAIFCEACGTRLGYGEKVTDAMVQSASAVQSTPSAQNTSPDQETLSSESVPPVYVQQPVPVLTAQDTQSSQPDWQTQVQQPFVPVQQPVQTSARKPVSKWMKVLLVEAALLLLIGYAFFSQGKTTFSAEKTAETFFVHVAGGNWEEAFALLDVEESAFITPELFAEANRDGDFDMITNYAVGGESPFGEGGFDLQSALGKTVEIAYRSGGSTENRYFQVNLNRQAGKKLFFFEDWKVGTDNLICRDYRIRAPYGASVTLDGILLDDTYRDNSIEDDYGRECWLIPQLFVGSHTLTVSMDGWEDVTGQIQVGPYDGEYWSEDMRLKQETQEMLVQKAAADLQAIYAAVLAGQDFDTISGLFTAKEEERTEIQEGYYYLLEYYQEDMGATPERIEFYNLSGEVYPDNTWVNLSFSYAVNYTYEKWDGGLVSSSYQDGSSIFSFYYTKENGSWVLTNLGCTTLYY